MNNNKKERRRRIRQLRAIIIFMSDTQIKGLLLWIIFSFSFSRKKQERTYSHYLHINLDEIWILIIWMSSMRSYLCQGADLQLLFL